MNKFELQLLQISFEKFRKNSSSYTEFQPRNGGESIYFSDALEYLEESGYVIANANNLANGSVSLFSSGTILKYELTEKGLRFSETTFNV